MYVGREMGLGGTPFRRGRSWVPASGELGTTVKLDAVGKPRAGSFWFQGLGGGLWPRVITDPSAPFQKASRVL